VEGLDELRRGALVQKRGKSTRTELVDSLVHHRSVQPSMSEVLHAKKGEEKTRSAGAPIGLCPRGRNTTHVESILEDEEASDLPGDGGDSGEGNGVGRHAKVLGHRVETPDLSEAKEVESGQLELSRYVKSRGPLAYLRELDGEVREEDELGAVPLLLRSRDLALHR
jgi:hypothetical protein